jgi:hypothetical protein
MPVMHITIPNTRSGLILSFKNMAASTTANTGDDVVPIKARLMAEA